MADSRDFKNERTTIREGWISVKDEFPEDFKRVIYWDSRDGGWHEVGHFVPSQSKVPDFVTHWMPLPPPPTDKQDKP